jgi:hypothetical protein
LSDEWFVAIKWCLDQTDADLRIRRNRIIHDKVHVDSEGVHRVQAKTGFRKPQAFQLEYYTEVIEPIDAEQIWCLATDIQNMIVRLDVLWRAGYEKDKDWKKELEARNLSMGT